MPRFTIHAEGPSGSPIIADTAETARDALNKYRAACPLFPAVWVTEDCRAEQVDEIELIYEAEGQGGG